MAFSGTQITRLGLIAITRGLYGSFAGKEEAEVVEERNRGGWLSPEQVDEIQRINREARKRKRDRRENRLKELETLFDTITLPPEIQPEVAEIVSPFTQSTETKPKEVPPTQAIDFTALLNDIIAVRNLTGLLLENTQITEEEEMLLLMIA